MQRGPRGEAWLMDWLARLVERDDDRLTPHQAEALDRARAALDAKRIGVYGWSYGGYMVLKLLAAAPDAGVYYLCNPNNPTGLPIPRADIEWLLANKPAGSVLLVDEATSALDSEVEAAIQTQLERLMRGKTVIAIAHRLSTIARMDRLVVMDRGRIIEQGSHDELLARGGIYAGLWARQSGGFLESDDSDMPEPVRAEMRKV